MASNSLTVRYKGGLGLGGALVAHGRVMASNDLFVSYKCGLGPGATRAAVRYKSGLGLGGRVRVRRAGVGVGYPLFRNKVRVRQVFQVFMYFQ